MRARLRLLILAFATLAMSSCTKAGINAGERGGIAFIALTGMLILTILILWFFLGREE